MSNKAETRAAHVVQPRGVEATNQTGLSYPVGVTIRATFAQVASMSGMSVPLRRPLKRTPSSAETELQAELDAWDAGSDEAFGRVDEGSEE
jgi:hypothetical protein